MTFAELEIGSEFLVVDTWAPWYMFGKTYVKTLGAKTKNDHEEDVYVFEKKVTIPPERWYNAIGGNTVVWINSSYSVVLASDKIKKLIGE